MPFTPAHPALALPLARAMGSQDALSALVIGSMAPDFVYLLPTAVSRTHTHSLAGIIRRPSHSS